MLKQLLSLGMTAIAASTATGVAGLVLSKRDTGRAAAGFDATSHIVWGDKAFEHSEFDFKHTVVGIGLNVGAMWAWAAVYQLLPPTHRLTGKLLKGAAVSALAYVTDYYLVPKRFTPGFEQRFTAGSMLKMYGILALSLAVGDRFPAVAKPS